MKIIIRMLPLFLFILLGLLLWRGLSLDSHKLPSQLINKPAPQLGLQQLFHPENILETDQLKGKFYLLHIWASWCQTCREEQPMLMDLANQGISIIGIDYKDNAKDAAHYLSQYGNPYQKIGFDAQGLVSINWGVYGTPETFLIDNNGIIRYKQIGAITHEIWETQFLPIIKQFS